MMAAPIPDDPPPMMTTSWSGWRSGWGSDCVMRISVIRPPRLGCEVGLARMAFMHLDHLSFAAGASGLDVTAKELGDALGTDFLDGGIHPRFGTRNRILPLANQQYVEIVEVLD